jgi:hypothetical protein
MLHGLLFAAAPKTFYTMKKITLLLAALFVMLGSYSQTKIKSTDEKSKVKTSDEKTKVKDNKVKSKDAAGSKTKIKAPAPVLKAFTADHPDLTNATWTTSRGNWTVKYKMNDTDMSTTYHANGDRVDTRTWYTLETAPQAVVTYRNANPGVQLKRIIMINAPEKDDVYELYTTTGQTIYIDGNGSVVTYTPAK